MEDPRVWHVLYTMPKAERKVSSELKKLDYKAYLPMIKVVRQWSDRVKKLTVPLFPNYVFVNTIPANRGRILRLPGVIRFLATKGNVDSISEHEISLIKQIVYHNPQVSTDHFSVGDTVKFTSGPFSGIEGKLITINGKRKLSVHLSTLGRTLLVESTAENLAISDLQSSR